MEKCLIYSWRIYVVLCDVRWIKEEKGGIKMIMWLWVGGCIVFLLVMGYIVDCVVIRRSIEFSFEDGIKNVIDVE